MSTTSLERTAKALRVWQANPEMKLKDLTVKEFQVQYDRMDELQPEIEALEEKLTPLRNERDALAKSMSKTPPACAAASAATLGKTPTSTNSPAAPAPRSAARAARRNPRPAPPRLPPRRNKPRIID